MKRMSREELDAYAGNLGMYGGDISDEELRKRLTQRLSRSGGSMHDILFAVDNAIYETRPVCVSERDVKRALIVHWMRTMGFFERLKLIWRSKRGG